MVYLNKLKKLALLLSMGSIVVLCLILIAEAEWQPVVSDNTSASIWSSWYTITYPLTDIETPFITDLLSTATLPTQPYFSPAYDFNTFIYPIPTNSPIDLFNWTWNSPRTINNPFKLQSAWSWGNPYYQQDQFPQSIPLSLLAPNFGWNWNNPQQLTYNFIQEVPTSGNWWKDQNLKTPDVSNVQIDIQEKTKEEEDIMEATFRYQFLHDQYKTEVYFLSRGQNQDPTDEFMNRFEDHKPPVKKVSESRKTATEGVIDRDTGEKGVIFNIQSIMWISESEVHVEGDDYRGNVGASGSTYYLKKENGKWIVMEARMHWIA
ncbi:MAG: hypothetical protein ACMUJM_21170 [bacterium]